MAHSITEKISKAGYNETLQIPRSYQDTSSTAAIMTRNLDVSLRSVAKHIGIIHNKIQNVEVAAQDMADTKKRLNNLEAANTAHTKILTEMYEMLLKISKPVIPAMTHENVHVTKDADTNTDNVSPLTCFNILQQPSLVLVEETHMQPSAIANDVNMSNLNSNCNFEDKVETQVNDKANDKVETQVNDKVEDEAENKVEDKAEVKVEVKPEDMPNVTSTISMSDLIVENKKLRKKQVKNTNTQQESDEIVIDVENSDKPDAPDVPAIVLDSQPKPKRKAPVLRKKIGNK